MMLPIILLSLVGLGVSLYSFFVEQKLAKNAAYTPACDISDRISCSKPFKSPHGKLLAFSNTIWSMFFYALMAVLAFFNLKAPVLLLSVAGAALSIFLAYILFTKIKTLCPLCISLYIINGLLLILAYQAWVS